MSDVRSLLRNELAARGQTTSKTSASTTSSKKRKAAGVEPDTRAKKTRNIGGPQSLAAIKAQQHHAEHLQRPPSRHAASEPDLETVPEEETAAQEEADVVAAAPVPLDQPVTVQETAALDADPKAPEADEDEDEWAAFEREVAAEEASNSAPRTSALSAAATIEAKPMIAEEIAAKAREEASTQRGRREEEAEEEKEEADQRLLEEFEEMEGLEERVRKLRERREMLRRGSETHEDATTVNAAVEEDKIADKVEEEEEDESSDEEDEWEMRGRR